MKDNDDDALSRATLRLASISLLRETITDLCKEARSYDPEVIREIAREWQVERQTYTTMSEMIGVGITALEALACAREDELRATPQSRIFTDEQSSLLASSRTTHRCGAALQRAQRRDDASASLPRPDDEAGPLHR